MPSLSRTFLLPCKQGYDVYIYCNTDEVVSEHTAMRFYWGNKPDGLIDTVDE